MQAGREIRVIVQPEHVDDDGAVAALARDRPRDREGARVPGPDQGHRHPRVARHRLRALSSRAEQRSRRHRASLARGADADVHRAPPRRAGERPCRARDRVERRSRAAVVAARLVSTISRCSGQLHVPGLDASFLRGRRQRPALRCCTAGWCRPSSGSRGRSRRRRSRPRRSTTSSGAGSRAASSARSSAGRGALQERSISVCVGVVTGIARATARRRRRGSWRAIACCAAVPRLAGPWPRASSPREAYAPSRRCAAWLSSGARARRRAPRVRRRSASARRGIAEPARAADRRPLGSTACASRARSSCRRRHARAAAPAARARGAPDVAPREVPGTLVAISTHPEPFVAALLDALSDLRAPATLSRG